MTERTLSPMESGATRLLDSFTTSEFANFFADGFRNLAGNDKEPPFGPVYAYLFGGDDITEDLAAVFRHLSRSAQRSFRDGLGDAFRRLSAARSEDQRALTYLLRLGAKVRCYELLPFITQKLFSFPNLEPKSSDDLRSLALDTAIELSAGSSDSGRSLRDIAQSRLFRPTAVATLLLALSTAEPIDILDHLLLLEDALVKVYGVGPAADEDALYMRALLITDLADCVVSSAMSDAVAFAFTNPSWRLSWFGEIVLLAPDLPQLDDVESEKASALRRKLLKCPSIAIPGPTWFRAHDTAPLSNDEMRAQTSVLNADEIDRPAENAVFVGLIANLIGPARHNPAAGSTPSLVDYDE